MMDKCRFLSNNTVFSWSLSLAHTSKFSFTWKALTGFGVLSGLLWCNCHTLLFQKQISMTYSMIPTKLTALKTNTHTINRFHETISKKNRHTIWTRWSKETQKHKQSEWTERERERERERVALSDLCLLQFLWVKSSWLQPDALRFHLQSTDTCQMSSVSLCVTFNPTRLQPLTGQETVATKNMRFLSLH